MNNTRISLATVAFTMFSILTGCSDGSHQTVEWYVEHQTERESKLKWCKDDMARAPDPDCLNAAKAKERVMLSGASAADSFQFNPGAVPQGSSPASAAAAGTPATTQAPTKPQKSAADTFKFDPNKVPKGGN